MCIKKEKKANLFRFLLKRERNRARDREKRQRKKRRSLVSTIEFPRIWEFLFVYNLHGVQMYLTIIVLFEAEVLRRFQDIFYQDSVLLKFWLVLLLNFINLGSLVSWRLDRFLALTRLYKLTFMPIWANQQNIINRLLRKTAFYKVNLMRVFSQVWVSFSLFTFETWNKNTMQNFFFFLKSSFISIIFV